MTDPTEDWVIEVQATLVAIEAAAFNALRHPDLGGHICPARAHLQRLMALAANGKKACPCGSTTGPHPDRYRIRRRSRELQK